MTTVKFEDGRGVKIKIFDADRVNANKQIFKDWQKNFNDLKLENKLVTEKQNVDPETNEISYIEEINKSSFESQYKNIKQSYDNYLKDGNKTKLYQSWKDNLSTFGVIVDTEAFELYIQKDKAILSDTQKGIRDIFKYA